MLSRRLEEFKSEILEKASCPEQALWLNVIWQAIRDAHHPTGYSSERGKIRYDAESWLSGSQSLMYVCDMAGLEYGYLKRKLETIFTDNINDIKRHRKNCRMRKHNKKRYS